MADSRLPALTEISAPVLLDELYVVDVSDTTDHASGTSRKITGSRLGGLLDPSICQGRLTLESGVPIPTTDQTAKTSIYFALYNGNRIAIYDGTRWKLYLFSELTLAIGTLTDAKNYDVFVYDNAGTLTLEFSAAWTNDTTRADALTTQDGVYVKSGATTRRWLGTFRTTATTTTEDSVLKRFVWNAHNRVPRHLVATDTTDSWSYTTNTIRQANATSANKVEYVCGSIEDAVEAEVKASVTAYANASFACKVGVGVDSTSTFSGVRQQVYIAGLTAANTPLGATYRGFPGLGYHYLSWNEKGGDVNCSYIGDNTGDGSQSGITAEVLA